MPDYLRSLIAFQRRFPDDRAGAEYLLTVRWPAGFRCPACGHDWAWALETKAWTFECAKCAKQTSVTSSTIIHGGKLALHIWFWAAYLMAAHSNGISAMQLWKQLGLGSYKSAWLLCAKLRRAMLSAQVLRLEKPCAPRAGQHGPPWHRSHDSTQLFSGRTLSVKCGFGSQG